MSRSRAGEYSLLNRQVNAIVCPFSHIELGSVYPGRGVGVEGGRGGGGRFQLKLEGYSPRQGKGAGGRVG